MSARERKAHNRAKIEERENALGAVFGWTPGDDFSFGRLSPADYECAGKTGWTVKDHLAGFDHLTWYHEDGRPATIVSQPIIRPSSTRSGGLVAEVERVRGIRVVELNPVLGWYSLVRWTFRPRLSSGCAFRLRRGPRRRETSFGAPIAVGMGRRNSQSGAAGTSGDAPGTSHTGRDFFSSKLNRLRGMGTVGTYKL